MAAVYEPTVPIDRLVAVVGAHVVTADASAPVILVPFTAPDKVRGLLVIDGWTQLLSAIATSRTELPAWVLTEEAARIVGEAVLLAVGLGVIGVGLVGLRLGAGLRRLAADRCGIVGIDVVAVAGRRLANRDETMAARERRRERADHAVQEDVLAHLLRHRLQGHPDDDGVGTDRLDSPDLGYNTNFMGNLGK